MICRVKCRQRWQTEINILHLSVFWWFYFDLHNGFLWSELQVSFCFRAQNMESYRLVNIKHCLVSSKIMDTHILLENNVPMQSFFLKKRKRRLEFTTECLNMEKIVTQRWMFMIISMYIAKCRLWLRYLILSISIYLSSIFSSYVNENMILCFYKCPLGMILFETFAKYHKGILLWILQRCSTRLFCILLAAFCSIFFLLKMQLYF